MKTKKNFPTVINNEVYWISRSCAVSGFVFKKIKGLWYVLINKRGKGSADYQGYWNAPCGYIDYGENGEQAVAREVLEECGFVSKPNKWKQIETVTDPKENLQNITIRYMYIADSDEDFDLTKRNGGEENEVEEVKWVCVHDLHNYVWAFDHGFVIYWLVIKHLITYNELREILTYGKIKEKEEKD